MRIGPVLFLFFFSFPCRAQKGVSYLSYDWAKEQNRLYYKHGDPMELPQAPVKRMPSRFSRSTIIVKKGSKRRVVRLGGSSNDLSAKTIIEDNLDKDQTIISPQTLSISDSAGMSINILGLGGTFFRGATEYLNRDVYIYFYPDSTSYNYVYHLVSLWCSQQETLVGFSSVQRSLSSTEGQAGQHIMSGMSKAISGSILESMHPWIFQESHRNFSTRELVQGQEYDLNFLCSDEFKQKSRLIHLNSLGNGGGPHRSNGIHLSFEMNGHQPEAIIKFDYNITLPYYFNNKSMDMMYYSMVKRKIERRLKELEGKVDIKSSILRERFEESYKELETSVDDLAFALRDHYELHKNVSIANKGNALAMMKSMAQISNEAPLAGFVTSFLSPRRLTENEISNIAEILMQSGKVLSAREQLIVYADKIYFLSSNLDRITKAVHRLFNPNMTPEF